MLLPLEVGHLKVTLEVKPLRNTRIRRLLARAHKTRQQEPELATVARS